MRQITKGATDQSTIVRIVDSTDGTPETGVTSATAGLDLKYRREGALPVDLTESDLGAVNSAHSDGGMIHIGAGYYRVDLPDAAVATGADGVLVFGSVTGMVAIAAYHELVDAKQTGDSFARLGAPAGASVSADIATRSAPGDAMDLIVDALDAAALATGARDEIVDQVWDETRSGHTAAGSYGESFTGIVNFTVAAGSTTTVVETDLTEATNDHYNGRTIVFITGALAGQATDITDYNGATGQLTVTALTEAPANGDRAVIV